METLNIKGNEYVTTAQLMVLLDVSPPTWSRITRQYGVKPDTSFGKHKLWLTTRIDDLRKVITDYQAVTPKGRPPGTGGKYKQLPILAGLG